MKKLLLISLLCVSFYGSDLILSSEFVALDDSVSNLVQARTILLQGMSRLQNNGHLVPHNLEAENLGRYNDQTLARLKRLPPEEFSLYIEKIKSIYPQGVPSDLVKTFDAYTLFIRDGGRVMVQGDNYTLIYTDPNTGNVIFD